jgi:acyl-homoserine lactone acylase PvdQ
VLADSSGAVAYVQTGQVDVRPPGWTGAVPWPGWELASRTPGVRGEEARPIAMDPPEGCVLSANEARRGPRGEIWASYPEPRYRHDRLGELFAGDGKASLATLARASYDPVDLCARRLLVVWSTHLPKDDEATSLVAWAERQPTRADADHFTKMGLFHALHREVMIEVLAAHVGEPRARKLIESALGDVCFQYHVDDALALERPELLDATALREALARAWPRARALAAARLAPAPVTTRFKNLLTQGRLPFLGLDSPPIRLAGGPTTLFQSRIVDVLGLRVASGPAGHYLTDMSERGGWYNVAGGASERRFGPGYGRGVREWSTGRFFPLGVPAGPEPRV